MMRRHLKSWLAEHDITGPPPSAEAEQRAMWQWIRDFHKEYSEDWFTRNMPRLKDQFKPLFMQEIKEMKKSQSPQSDSSTTGGDLLAMDGSPVKNKDGKSNDLLGFDDSAPTVTEATSSDLLGSSETLLTGSSNLPATASSGGYSGAVELGDVLGSNQASFPPAAAASPSGDGLLGLDLGSFAPAQQTSAPVPSSLVPQLAATELPQQSPQSQQPVSQAQLQQLQQLLQQQPAMLAALQQQLQPLAQQQQQTPAATQQQLLQPMSQQQPFLQQPMPQQQPAVLQQPQMDPVQQLQSQLQSLSVAPNSTTPSASQKEDNLFDFNLM